MHVGQVAGAASVRRASSMITIFCHILPAPQRMKRIVPDMQLARIGLLFIVLLALSGCLRQEPNRAPVIHYGFQGGADSAGIHTVSGGDTLWDIAQRYRLSMQDIIYLNKLYPPYALDTGDRLVLPPPATYQVKAQDTLYGISRTFDVSMTELARLNRLSAPYTIREGEKVRLPSGLAFWIERT